MRLIDAHALLNRVRENALSLDETALQKVFSLIVETPTADTEPVKHGKWINYPAVYECSECGVFHDKGRINYFEYRFCPWCGAKMENLKGKIMNEWISVKDRLPEKVKNEFSYSGNVLITDGEKIDIGYYNHSLKSWLRYYVKYSAEFSVDDKNITHWMPLPTPPKKEEP